jgi:hypothetical protein
VGLGAEERRGWVVHWFMYCSVERAMSFRYFIYVYIMINLYFFIRTKFKNVKQKEKSMTI